MIAKKKAAQKNSSYRLYAILIVVGGVAYYLVGGSDAPATAPKPLATSSPSAGTSPDIFTPADYKASFPVLKVAVKDTFLPLIRKSTTAKPSGDKGGLPASITGGGDWSYDGMVAINGQVQGLMDEVKTGESDFISLGSHWKHGKAKRITDSEIVFIGDDGHTAMLKVGDSSAKAEKVASSAPAPTDPVQPPALTGEIGNSGMDISALPPTDENGGNNNFRRGRGRGGRGRGGGGFGGGGFGG